MDKKTTGNDFDHKFSELSAENQKYIIAMQQALHFAQATEKEMKKQEKDKVS